MREDDVRSVLSDGVHDAVNHAVGVLSYGRTGRSIPASGGRPARAQFESVGSARIGERKEGGRNPKFELDSHDKILS
jgi:hypothetical protein